MYLSLSLSFYLSAKSNNNYIIQMQPSGNVSAELVSHCQIPWPLKKFIFMTVHKQYTLNRGRLHTWGGGQKLHGATRIGGQPAEHAGKQVFKPQSNTNSYKNKNTNTKIQIEIELRLQRIKNMDFLTALSYWNFLLTILKGLPYWTFLLDFLAGILYFLTGLSYRTFLLYFLTGLSHRNSSQEFLSVLS